MLLQGASVKGTFPKYTEIETTRSLLHSKEKEGSQRANICLATLLSSTESLKKKKIQLSSKIQPTDAADTLGSRQLGTFTVFGLVFF